MCGWSKITRPALTMTSFFAWTTCFLPSYSNSTPFANKSPASESGIFVVGMTILWTDALVSTLRLGRFAFGMKYDYPDDNPIEHKSDHYFGVVGLTILLQVTFQA